MKNTMREGRDRELMVNIFTPPLLFTYSSSMQNRVITSCKKKKKKKEKIYGEIGRKVVMHSEDYACNLCRAEKRTQTSLLGSILTVYLVLKKYREAIICRSQFVKKVPRRMLTVDIRSTLGSLHCP